MNRRAAIRNAVIISAGVGLLPSCVGDNRSSIALKNISLTGTDEKMLAALTEAIIPRTKDFIGAVDIKAHEFLLTMLDDCSPPTDQREFTKGLAAFNRVTHDKFGQPFSAYSAAQKAELLRAIENKKDITIDAINFYSTVKKYTIQAFASSKDYMLAVKKYTMVPGPHFKGCVPDSKYIAGGLVVSDSRVKNPD